MILLQLFLLLVLFVTPHIYGDIANQHQSVEYVPLIESFDDEPNVSQTVVSDIEESNLVSLSCPSVDLILDDIEKLNVENAELKAQVDTLSNVISEQTALIHRLTEESISSVSIPSMTSDCNDHEALLTTYQQQVGNLTTYSASLQAQLLSVSKNMSMLEIKLSLEKNEKLIARLSRDNCMLELTNLKDMQDEDLSATRQEAALLRSQLISTEQHLDQYRKKSTQVMLMP